MRKDAETNAASDKQKMELVEARNLADQAIYAARKALTDNKDKIPADLGSSITEKVSTLEAVKNGDDLTKIKTASEDLSKELSKVYEAIQKASGAQEPPKPGEQRAPEDGPEDKPQT
jgi:molecular chaperone DnaK